MVRSCRCIARLAARRLRSKPHGMINSTSGSSGTQLGPLPRDTTAGAPSRRRLHPPPRRAPGPMAGDVRWIEPLERQRRGRDGRRRASVPQRPPLHVGDSAGQRVQRLVPHNQSRMLPRMAARSWASSVQNMCAQRGADDLTLRHGHNIRMPCVRMRSGSSPGSRNIDLITLPNHEARRAQPVDLSL